jgi:hypothetical protein
VAHSHLVIQHLLKQIEGQSQVRKDKRPKWLIAAADRFADAFDPLGEVGRVGYECEWTDWGWELRMYLGMTEVVGGKYDGDWQGASFELDVARLVAVFDEPPAIAWSVSASKPESSRSFLTITGTSDNEPLRLKVYSLPPRESSPVLTRRPDGSIEPKE